MIAQVTAAALASENKSLAHPASVDSLPTSANRRITSACHLRRAAPRRDGGEQRRIVAIELLAAAQGIDFRAPAAHLREPASKCTRSCARRSASTITPLFRARHHRDPSADRGRRLPSLRAGLLPSV